MILLLAFWEEMLEEDVIMLKLKCWPPFQKYSSRRFSKPCFPGACPPASTPLCGVPALPVPGTWSSARLVLLLWGAGTHGPSAGLPDVLCNFRPLLFLINNWGNKCLPNASLSSFLPQINSTKICWLSVKQWRREKFTQ